MAGRNAWSTLQKKMTPEQRARSEEKAAQIRTGMLVAEMRKQSGMTQAELAERLGVSQPRLSDIESGDDLRVGTLNRIVTELGGQLVIHTPLGDRSLTPTD